MPITSRLELQQAVEQVDSLIQEISDYTNTHPVHEQYARIRFPTGFLKTAAFHRQRLSFVPEARTHKNLSYAMMTHDVLRWLVTRTRIGGQAKEMIIKEAICLIGSVCETITIWPGEVGLGKSKSFAARTMKLQELGVIDADTETDLNWVWEIRCREHIAGVAIQEWNHYTMDHWVRSIKAYKALRNGIALWKEN